MHHTRTPPKTPTKLNQTKLSSPRSKLYPRFSIKTPTDRDDRSKLEAKKELSIIEVLDQ
jgi:hypothetical protein